MAEFVKKGNKNRLKELMSSKFRRIRMAAVACDEIREHIRQPFLKIDEVDVYKELIARVSKENFYFFAKIVLGFDKLRPIPHKQYCNRIQKNLDELSYIMRLYPRGFYKTTIFTQALPLWLWACKDPGLRLLIVSANSGLLSEISSHLNHLLSDESLYSFVFDINLDATAKNTENIFNINKRDKDVKGHSMVLRSVTSNITGLHPNIIFLDDCVTQEDRESSVVRTKKQRVFDSLIPLIVQSPAVKLKLLYVGTRWHLKDLPGYIIEKNEDISEETEKFDIDIDSVVNKDGWPKYNEYFGAGKIKALKERLEESFFYSQYQNIALNEKDQVFNLAKLHVDYIPLKYIEREGSNYCVFDPSKGNENSDYAACIWVNVYNGKMTLIDAIDEKLPLDETLALCVEKNKKYKVAQMIFEDNGTLGLLQLIRSMHVKVGYSCYIIPVHETRNKKERICSIQPYLYGGQFRFARNWKHLYPNLMLQLLEFPQGRYDDFPDVIEKAIKHLWKFMHSNKISESENKTISPGLNTKTQW